MIKRNFFNTFIHNSEKKTIPICLSIFFKYNIKSQFMFTICSCLNYIFLLIFAHVTDNQAWKQINRKDFHDQENPENRFSKFSYFMEG